MDILTWAENEIKRYDEVRLNGVREAFRALVSDKPSDWDIAVDADILVRLANWMPLTPIEEDADEVWMQESGVYEDGSLEYVCGRYPSLTKNVRPDGKTKYYDDSRFEYYDIDDGRRTVLDNGVALVVNYDIFPLTLPYYPPMNRTRIFIKTFSTVKNGWCNTIGIYYAENPYGEQTDIERWFKWSKKKDDWVEISYVEYILRLAFAGV